jgi:hypothetical protein
MDCWFMRSNEMEVRCFASPPRGFASTPHARPNRGFNISAFAQVCASYQTAQAQLPCASENFPCKGLRHSLLVGGLSETSDLPPPALHTSIYHDGQMSICTNGVALSTAMSNITRHQELKVCTSTRYIINANRIRCIILNHDHPIARNRHAIAGGVHKTQQRGWFLLHLLHDTRVRKPEFRRPI